MLRIPVLIQRKTYWSETCVPIVIDKSNMHFNI